MKIVPLKKFSQEEELVGGEEKMSGTLSMEHIQLGMSRGPAIEDASLLGSFMT